MKTWETCWGNDKRIISDLSSDGDSESSDLPVPQRPRKRLQKQTLEGSQSGDESPDLFSDKDRFTDSFGEDSWDDPTVEPDKLTSAEESDFESTGEPQWQKDLLAEIENPAPSKQKQTEWECVKPKRN